MTNGETSQIESRQVWREDGTDRGPCEPDSERGPDGDVSIAGSEYQRTDRTIRPGGAYTDIIGGIYTQLIQQAERRLGNAVACIDWYDREKNEALQELTQLREKLALLNLQDESGKSTESDRPI